jgi:hypothetical protein
MLSLFLFDLDAAYSGGACGIAAASLADAQRIASEYECGYLLRPIASRYDTERRALVPQAAAVPGVHVEGEPRVLFDLTYIE